MFAPGTHQRRTLSRLRGKHICVGAIISADYWYTAARRVAVYRKASIVPVEVKVIRDREMNER